MEKQKVKIEEEMPREVLAERFRKMALDIDNGQLEIQSGDKVITLSIPESMPLEVEAKQKETKEKLVIEISWRETTATPDKGEHTPELIEETTVTDSDRAESLR